MQIFYITVNVALIMQCFLKPTPHSMKKLNSKLDNDTVNKQKSSALQGIISILDLYGA